MTLGAALTFGAFILTAPAPLLLLPLGLLLLAVRPVRWGHLLWAYVGLAITGLWFLVLGSLADQLLKGWTAVAAGLFALFTLRPGRRTIDAGILAILGASLAVMAWVTLYRISPDAVIADLLRNVWHQYRLIGDQLPDLRPDLDELATVIPTFVRLTPGLYLLTGLAGLVIARRWAGILAGQPSEGPPATFAGFTFSDHAIWLLILALAGVVLQVEGTIRPERLWPANLLVFSGGLYVARGAAIFRTVVTSGALLLWVTLGILFLVLWPIVISGLLGIGIADTWLDFRRRLAAAQGAT